MLVVTVVLLNSFDNGVCYLTAFSAEIFKQR